MGRDKVKYEEMLDLRNKDQCSGFAAAGAVFALAFFSAGSAVAGSLGCTAGSILALALGSAVALFSAGAVFVGAAGGLFVLDAFHGCCQINYTS